MRTNSPLHSLNAGEVSKIALGRVDIAKLRMAASCQLNWTPYVVGPMAMRTGMYYVGEIIGDAPAKLLRFIYSKLDTALIELTAYQMRVWVNEALVTRASVSTTVADSFFVGLGSWTTSNTTSGASVSIDGGVCTLTCQPLGGLAQIQQTVTVIAADRGKEHALRIAVTQGPVVFRMGSTVGGSDLIAQTTLDTGTHSLAFTPTSGTATIQIESTDAWSKTLTECFVEPPGAMIVPTPWAATDLPNIRYDQSGNIIFVACYGQQQYKIERRGVHSWSTVLFYSNNGPFQALPGIQANFTPGAYTGNTTLTSDRPWFQPGHVGCLFRLFSSGQLNQTVLGGQNTYTPPVRVNGVGITARDYTWTITGTWSGKLTFQRSFDGSTSGFLDGTGASGAGSPATSNGTITSNTGTGQTPLLDNVIAWERVGFKSGDYTSGTATLVSNFNGGGGYGTCRVTSVNSTTSVNIEVLEPFSSLTATTDWVEGDWSNVNGWPTSVCFHEGRLCWFGGNQIWASASDDFTNYADINLDGTSTGDGGAINVTLGSGPVDNIPWGLSLTRLAIGREQSIMSARSSNFDQPLTPTAIVIRDCSDQGAQRLQAVKCGKNGIFVQQSGRRVYELAFSQGAIDYDTKDLTRLNLDIGLPGFVDIDKATQPDTMVYLVRGDGQCAAILYDPKDEVEAWVRIQTLGIIENVCVLPQNAPEDLVYFVVRRNINGQVCRFIERLAARTNCIGGAINQQLDCHSVFTGSQLSSVQVPQLPNTLVAVWADGQFIGTTTTDASGNCSMPDGLLHNSIVVGLAGAVLSVTTTNLFTPSAGGGIYTLPGISPNIAFPDGLFVTDASGVTSITNTLKFGLLITAYNAGTIISGTYVPNAVNGNYQYYVNAGAHMISPPVNDCALDLTIINGPSAGIVTFDPAFRVGINVGDNMDTGNGHVFLVSIRRTAGFATYVVKALQ